MRPITAWAIAQKKKETVLATNRNKRVVGLNFNNVNLNHVFEWDSDMKLLKQKNGFKTLKKACAFNHDLSYSDIKQEIKPLNNLEPQQYIRGKFAGGMDFITPIKGYVRSIDFDYSPFAQEGGLDEESNMQKMRIANSEGNLLTPNN